MSKNFVTIQKQEDYAMTEISLKTGYTIVRSFFKYFSGNFYIEYLLRQYNGKRGFKRQLSIQDVKALNIYRYFRARRKRSLHAQGYKEKHEQAGYERAVRLP